ncbi:hypothetical protein Acr_11g0017340 [Actinidia rufa]|uniref:Uncharacterized protein n=1 Tax=Actinidia rufa TaxID=165716 RepID=A0A7J0FFG8_9ERIC|nr:hypothetical protein Acr_11g0017340 [Actinidia rufa]
MEAFEKLDRERGYGYDRGMEEEDQTWKWTSTIKEREKDRLTPIVEALSTSYLGPDYSQPREFADIFLKDIDQVAKSSFPLCIRHLFDKVKFVATGVGVIPVSTVVIYERVTRGARFI